MRLGDNVPVWVREKRPPTRAELAAKHVSDGGSMAYGVPPSPSTDAFFKEAPKETELVPVGDTGTFVRLAKETPAVKIAVKRYNA